MLIVDSQCVSTNMQKCEDKGFNGGKHRKGKKRTIVTDTLGMLWNVIVEGANMPEKTGAIQALCTLPSMPRLEKILFDQGYIGEWLRPIEKLLDCKTHIVEKDGLGFKVQQWRWIVERTFAWFSGYRRLSKDYESKTQHSESYLYFAMSRLILKRIC